MKIKKLDGLCFFLNNSTKTWRHRVLPSTSGWRYVSSAVMAWKHQGTQAPFAVGEMQTTVLLLVMELRGGGVISWTEAQSRQHKERKLISVKAGGNEHLKASCLRSVL